MRKSDLAIGGITGLVLLAALSVRSPVSVRPIRPTGETWLRRPASGPIVVPRELLAGIALFRETIQSQGFNLESCALTLKPIYASLFRASPQDFDLKHVADHAAEIVQAIFESRLDMRAQLKRLEQMGTPSPDCLSSVRDILRASLFMQEYVAEHFLNPRAYDRVFEGDSPSLLVNPKFGGEFSLQSGDILLSRGNAFTSGAIARIGDTDGNFSHIALVWIDPKDGRAYTVEAHIEKGTVLEPIEGYLTDGKSRSFIYRQPDADLGHRAAQVMVDRVRKTKGNIPYDFGMVMEGQDGKGRDASHEVFCSEIAREAYKKASNGTFLIPRYRTGLHMKNRAFLRDLGVKARETFAPSDMEIDTRFEVVAEWRNFGKTQKSRMTDAILTRIYEFMERDGYVLEGTGSTQFISRVGYAIRRIPLLNGGVKDRFPLNMRQSAVNATMALDLVAQAMMTALEKASGEQKTRTGYSMTGREMAEFLEQLRAQDYQAYLTRRAFEREAEAHKFDESWYASQPIPPESLFHAGFHPVEEN